MSTTIDNFSSLIGGRLAEERRRLKLSQEAAGDVCGVSREMWGKYERGQAVMGTEVLAKFGQAGADVLYVVTGQSALHAAERPGQYVVTRPDEIALIDNYRASSPKGKDAIKTTSAALAESVQAVKKRGSAA